MEKTVKFSILKEKIIKTNELLHLHLDKCRELEKVQKCYQQIKSKLDFSKNEIQKFKLKDETQTFSLQLTDKKYTTLQKEHEILKSQYDQLEKEFGNTVNNLQLNYQHASQELCECKEKLSRFEDQGITTNQKSPVKRKKITPKSEAVKVEKKYTLLQREYDKLKEQFSHLQKEHETNINNCKSQTNKELRKCEQTELKDLFQNNDMLLTKVIGVERLNAVNQLPLADDNLELESQKLQNQNNTKVVEAEEKLKTELNLKQQEIVRLETKLKQCQFEKSQELGVLTQQLAEANFQIDLLKKQNEKLQTENSALKLEAAMIEATDVAECSQKAMQELHESNKRLNDEVNKLREIVKNQDTPTDQEIAEIMKQVTCPPLLSPLNEINEIYLDEKEENVPSPLPTRGKHIRSSSGKFTISNFSERRLSRSKVCRKRQKRRLKKKSGQIDLLKTLLTLKKANLNFVISNESLPPVNRIGSYYLHKSRPIQTRHNSVPEKQYPTNNFVSALECNLECCNSCHMLLRNGEDIDAPLLGFFDVKSERSSVWDVNNDKSAKLPPHRSFKSAKNVDTDNFQHTVTQCDVVDKGNNFSLEPEQGDTENDHLTLESDSGRSESVDVALDIQNMGSDIGVPLPFDTVDKDKSMLIANNCKKSGANRGRKRCNPISRKLLRHSYSTRTVMSTVSSGDDSLIPAKKRIAHVPKPLVDNDHNTSQINQNTQGPEIKSPLTRQRSFIHSKTDSLNDQEFKIDTPKSPKTTFKRPVIRTRRSPRLLSTSEVDNDLEKNENPQVECPQSPPPTDQSGVLSTPKIIPLDRVNNEKLPTTKIEVLFTKLVNFSMEEEVLNEVVREFTSQDPEYVAEAILEKISKDFHDTPDTKYYPAPLMTDTQRVMLGFMSKLEKANLLGVFDSYLTLSEHRLLTNPVLQEIAPITRLYLAICKLRKDLQRMRKLCCDVFYFCGDFAVPFLFYVLTSWTEVLPHEVNSKDMPIARVLVQAVYMKDCNGPGYNLMPLRDLLIKFYEYPSERWDSDELFQELFHAYLRNPVRSSDFALLLLCKNHPEKWVHDKVQQHLKPLLDKIPAENFKAAVIILIGNLYHRFDRKSDANYLASIREWLRNLIIDSTPDVVKRSVYLSLNRLAKK